MVYYKKDISYNDHLRWKKDIVIMTICVYKKNNCGYYDHLCPKKYNDHDHLRWKKCCAYYNSWPAQTIIATILLSKNGQFFF